MKGHRGQCRGHLSSSRSFCHSWKTCWESLSRCVWDEKKKTPWVYCTTVLEYHSTTVLHVELHKAYGLDSSPAVAPSGPSAPAARWGSARTGRCSPPSSPAPAPGRWRPFASRDAASGPAAKSQTQARTISMFTDNYSNQVQSVVPVSSVAAA